MLDFKKAAVATGMSILAVTSAEAGGRSINQSKSVRSSTSVVTATESAARDHSTALSDASTGVAIDAYNGQAGTVGISAGFSANVPVRTGSGNSINQSNGTDSSSSVVTATTVKATTHSVNASDGSVGVTFDGALGTFGTIGVQAGFQSYAKPAATTPQP